MKQCLKGRLALAALVLALLGGAAAAVAATQSTSHSGRQAYLADVAKRLGISGSALTSAMRAAEIDRINAAVADGRLTKSQASVLEQRVREGRGPFAGRAFHGRGRGMLVTVVAAYVGISPETLRGERRAGKSLAQIAASTPGKSVAGLKAAISAAVRARIDAAVSRGRLSSAQARELLNHLPSRIDAFVQRTAVGARPHSQ